MGITTPHIDVARVVPALRGVLQQIDGADGKRHALDHRIRHTAGWQRRIGDEAQRLERAPWSNRAGSGRRVINQVRSLQVKTARAEITDLEGRILPQALLHGTIPLLNVLRWRMWIECRKAHCRRWQ